MVREAKAIVHGLQVEVEETVTLEMSDLLARHARAKTTFVSMQSCNVLN